MKYLKLKFLLLFFAIAAAFPPAWAETVEVTFDVGNGFGLLSQITASNNLVLSNNVLLRFEKATSSNAPVYNSNGSALRFYQSNTLTVSCNAGNLTSIVFTYATNYDNKDVSLVDEQPGEYNADSNTWTGSSESVQFINTGTVTRITKIVVTYETPEAPQPEANIYKKVTTASQIAEGKTYILVADNYAMGAVNGNTAPQIGVTIDNNTIDIAGTDVAEFELGTYYGTMYTLKNNGKYIGVNTTTTYFTTSDYGSQYHWDFDQGPDGYVAIFHEMTSYMIKRHTSQGVFLPSKEFSNVSYAYLYVKDDGEEPVVEDVATPTFSVETGTYTTAQTVEITCETQGATIHYTTDGNDPTTESAVYTEALTISTTTTLKAIAVKDGMNNSAVATATYTFPTIVTNLAQANALADGTNFVYNGYAVVTHVVDNTTYSNADVWLRDDLGNAAYLYRATPIGFANGDVLQTGWTATKASYKGLDELTNVTMVKTGTAEAKPVVLETITDADVSKYVRLENVTEVTGWYDKWNTGLTLEAGKTYNVEGIVGYYSGLQFWPLKVEEVEAPITELIITLAPAEATATAGENINVTVTANVEEVIYEYTVAPSTATLTETETGFTLTSATVGEVTVSVYGTDGNFEKTVEGTYTFEAAPAPLASEFVLVKDIAKLEDGKQIIIADKNAKASTSVMSSNQKTNNRGIVNLNVDENLTINVENSAAEIFTLKKVEDKWYLKARKTEGYLYAPGGDNYLRTSETPATNAQASIAIANDGVATVEFNTTADQRFLRYNSSSDLYSCYKQTSTMKAVYIYIEKSETPEPVDAGLAYEVTEFTVEASGDFTAPTLVNPNEVAPVTYVSSNEDVAVVDENTGEVVIGDAGTAVISAIFAGNDDFLADTASYTITVTLKDAGLKYETTAYNVYIGNDFTAPTLTNPNELTVAYSSSNEELAVVDANTGEVALGDEPGTVTISAIFAGNGQFAADTASYTITLMAKTVPTLSFGDETAFTIYADEEFTAPTLTTDPQGLAVKYTSSNEDVAMVDENTGEVVLMDGTGTTTITATYAGNEQYATATASFTLTVKARPELVVEPETLTLTAYTDETATATFDVLGSDLQDEVTMTLTDENGVYILDAESISIPDAQQGATITVTYAPNAAGTHAATITVASKDAQNVTVTLQGTATVRPVVEAPTFSLVSGSYGTAQTVTITGAPGATIYYTTDGSEPTTASTVYTGAIELGEGTTTIKAIAVQEGMTNSAVANAYYIIDLPEALPTITPFKGYYAIKNNGNNKYANVQGRKTLTFTDDIDKKAGTVIWLETNEVGQVQSLRSQGADLQGYADRAMRYVPKFVELAVNKLHAEGAGEILGETGLDKIMDKFNECFDHHLYVEQANGGYRLYGKTPSMQPVVDFYRENQAKVEAKLPMLEDFINSTIDKVLNKTNGQGASILQHFSVHDTWQRMDNSMLTEPVDSATTMDFYRQVLNDKNLVWTFAYETAMTYWERVKNHPNYETQYKPMLGEFADYIERIEDIRPDFKYYIVQDNPGTGPDYISEGNKAIKDNAGRTIWTLEERDNFTVNFSLTEDNAKYYTTLYTDFAYDLPEGVNAYIITNVGNNGQTLTQRLSGTIPAQTPVLLQASAAGDQVLTLAAAGTANVKGNLLVGADYFISKYELKTPQIADLFDMAKDLLGETFYQNYIAEYEHLMLKNSGTVNNKYFWGLTQDDLYQCIERDENDEGICVVRSLSVGADGIGFYDNMTAGANQAFLDNYTFDPVKLVIMNDVTRDGLWDIEDVTATINISLGKAPQPNNYDYDAADFNNDGKIEVDDVSLMINYILGK